MRIPLGFILWFIIWLLTFCSLTIDYKEERYNERNFDVTLPGWWESPYGPFIAITLAFSAGVALLNWMIK